MSRGTEGPAPHAPVVGRLARLLGPFAVTGAFWFRFHQFGARVAPRWFMPLPIVVFTSFFFLVLRRIRRGIAGNLDVALGPAGWLRRQARIWRTMHQFAWCLTERYENLGGEVTFDVTLEDPDVWHSIGATGGGFIIATAHVGSWEIGSALPSRAEGRTVHLVREEESDPRAQAFIRKLLTERMGPNYVTHFASDDPRLGLELLDVLRRGGIVALQADRPRRGGKIVSARLFGRPFALPLGLLALARSAEVPILPVFVFRQARRSYLVRFCEPIRVPRSRDRDQDLESAAGLLAREIEKAIRREPHQWFCFREIFV